MTPNLAFVVAMRMSIPPSISIPPATHGPFTAATIGLKILVSRNTARVPSVRRHPSTSVTSPVLICFDNSVICGMYVLRSAPAMKLRSTPVMIATQASSS